MVKVWCRILRCEHLPAPQLGQSQTAAAGSLAVAVMLQAGQLW